MGSGSSNLNSPSSTSTGLTIATVQSIRSQQTSSMGGSRGSSAASMTRIQQTVATYFRFSLMDLLAKMVAGSPHFVRCIRPNTENIPDKFDSKKVLVQLKYTGVLETTRIRREGYSHRVPFADFVKRYSLLALGKLGTLDPNKTGCEQLLTHLQLENWALGKTKVFLKFYHIELLARQYAVVETKVSRIQAAIRMHITRNQYYELKWKMIKSSTIIQKYTRGWIVRKKFTKLFQKRKLAAITVQKVVRGFLTRAHVLPVLQRKKASAVKIQSVYRGHRDRKLVKNMKDEQKQTAIKIQRAFRSMQAKRQAKAEIAQKQQDKLSNKDNAAVKIQSTYRMWKCKRVYKNLLKFREKKDLQLIYFTQQVEAYADDLSSKLVSTNISAKPVPLPEQSPELSSRRHVQSSPEPGPSSPKKGGKVKRSAPVPPLPVVMLPVARQPDVSEARLEHLDKMKELKRLLPDDELQYYSSLNVKQTATADLDITDNNSTTSSQRRLKTVMDEDTENYYATVVKRSSLSDSREDILALGETAASINHKHTNNWDAPLEIAKQKILSTSSNIQSNIPRPDIDIDEDLKTDREEFFKDTKKEDLLQTLHEEYKKSAKGKWHMLQKLISLGHFSSQQQSSNEKHSSFQSANQNQASHLKSTNHSNRPTMLTYQGHSDESQTPPSSKKTVIAVKYSGNHGNRQENGFHSGENGITNRTGSKVKFSPGEPTVINVQLHKKKTVVMDTNQNYLSSSLSPSSSESTNFRSVLKKTDIDLESIKHMDAESEKPIYDFRKMLRKTGRLDMIAQEQQ